MKSASRITTLIFMIMNIVSTAFAMLLLIGFIFFFSAADLNFNDNNEITLGISLGIGSFVFYILILVVFLVLNIVFGKKTIESIDNNKKNISIGVCNLIFVNVISGIIYLCWNPEDDIKKENPYNYNYNYNYQNTNTNNFNNTSTKLENTAGFKLVLVRLKELLDSQAISLYVYNNRISFLYNGSNTTDRVAVDKINSLYDEMQRNVITSEEYLAKKDEVLKSIF